MTESFHLKSIKNRLVRHKISNRSCQLVEVKGQHLVCLHGLEHPVLLFVHVNITPTFSETSIPVWRNQVLLPGELRKKTRHCGLYTSYPVTADPVPLVMAPHCHPPLPRSLRFTLTLAVQIICSSRKLGCWYLSCKQEYE